MFFSILAKNSITIFICMVRKLKGHIMKIQLITQNIKPMALSTQTNSNPILKNTPADSFEKQNVAFKGAPTKVAQQVAETTPTFEQKVLASIATKGEEGLDELCKDSDTAKAILTFKGIFKG